MAGDEIYEDEEQEQVLVAPSVSWADSLQEQFGSAPWWVISTVLHVIILMLMALITISVPDKDKDTTLILQDLMRAPPRSTTRSCRATSSRTRRKCPQRRWSSIR